MINLEKQFDHILEKNNEIENSLNNQKDFDTQKLIRLNKEYAEMKPIVDTIYKYKKLKSDILDLRALLDDKDSSIKQMADIELKNSKKKFKLFKVYV